MIKVIDVNDSGKTKKLLAACAEVNGLFVCKHPERVDEKCQAYNIRQVEAISYDEFVSKMQDENREVFIDELEKFVKQVYPSLAGYSLTIEAKHD